ncbi:MAG: hypothetical protein EOM26_10810, partial [Alphaproteobacteria bacterium]|nr:hypothetical protein [Alphaproteobacteria bacterium]
MAYDESADILDRETFHDLLNAKSGLCISIYMPTEQAGRETRQNAIRFDNLRRQAEEKLERYGVQGDARAAILAPLESIGRDHDFWQHQSEGLAVFANPVSHRALRLPVAFDEGCIVDKRFYIRPLIPLTDEGEPYHILALSRGETRLLRCTATGCVREDLPEHLASYGAFLEQYDYEEHLQQHYGDRVGGGEMHAIYHGRGGGKEATHHAHLKEYFSHLRHAVDKAIASSSQKLFLGGDSHEVGLYREVTAGQPLDVAILSQKNASDLTDAELRQSALEQVTPAHERGLRSALDEFERLRRVDPQKIESSLHEVVRAAHDKRVRVLFVPGEDSRVWGHYDPEDRRLEIETVPDANVGEEITNLAAAATLRNGGEVYV